MKKFSCPPIAVEVAKNIRERLQKDNHPNPQLGQIWRVHFGKTQSRLVVVTTGLLDSHPSGEPSVRVCPINTEYLVDDFDLRDDLVPTAEDSDLSLPFLIETWNERPVMFSHLITCLGCLKEAFSERLRERLLHPVKPVAVSPHIVRFRQQWICAAQDLSESYLSALNKKAKPSRKNQPAKPVTRKNRVWIIQMAKATNESALPLTGTIGKDEFQEIFQKIRLEADSIPDFPVRILLNVSSKLSPNDTISFLFQEGVPSFRVRLLGKGNTSLLELNSTAQDCELHIHRRDIKDWKKVKTFSLGPNQS